MSYSVKSIRKDFAARGVFYTDEKLASIIKDVVDSYGVECDDVYDPTCGSGNLLSVFPDNVWKYGQEINARQVQEAADRLVNSVIEVGDTLKSPAFLNRKFKRIVANYPFSIKWEPAEDVRWQDAPCLPPPSKADYAFILHILYMLADDGVAAVLGSPGICYRGQREGKIRQWLIEQNCIDCVMHIPGGFFEDTAVAPVLLVFRKNRTERTILFADIENEIERDVSLDEIAQNDYSLSVSTYVQKEKPKKEVDPVALEMRARQDVLRRIKAQLDFSSQAVELHKMLSLPPLPPIADFVSDLITLISPYAKENGVHILRDDK